MRFKVRYGAETIPYGIPREYIITARGLGEDRQIYQCSQTIDVNLLDYFAGNPWWLLAVAFQHLSDGLRRAGAEPMWWDCGGIWYESDDPTTDEYGDYKW